MLFGDDHTVVMPDNVDEQDRLIREAGILDLLQTGLGVQPGLLHWAGVQAWSYGVSHLVLCAGFRGGEFAVRPLAHNCVEAAFDDVMPPLTIEQLRLLEQLAVPPLQFRLERGRRFVYAGIEPPGRELLFPAGTLLTVEVATFGHVSFSGCRNAVARGRIVSPAFSELPSY